MTFQPPESAPQAPRESGQSRVDARNVISAFGSLAVAWFLDQARRGEAEPEEEAEPGPEPTPHDRLALLRLQHQISQGQPIQEESLPPEAPQEADFRELTRGVQLDINHPPSREAFLAALTHYEGAEYQWGALGRGFGGVDCSGLIVAVLKDQFGILKGGRPTAAYLHDHMTNPITDPAALKPGDLVFSETREEDTDKRGRTGIVHVAVVAEVTGKGIRLIESTKGGYRDDREISFRELRNGTATRTYELGTPIFFDPNLKNRFQEEENQEEVRATV